ncbi:MAG: arginase [Flavobacteriales bacterium]|nr:formimidoylglutamase [Bacteroidales bacterium AH-315-I05]PCJ89013.1 MAG: arginase [Flavobacteriales bacterium]
MDLQLYFKTIEHDRGNFKKNSLGEKVDSYTDKAGFPDLEGVDIAFVGVKEDRGAHNNKGCAEAPDVVRHFLFQLFLRDYKISIADLGNIMPGNALNDTYFAVGDVVSELIKRNIVPIVIGGGQDLTYANYTAYEKMEQVVNMVTVDNQFNLGEVDDELNSNSFLAKIILHQPNFLFNYSNIGYQTYFVDKNATELMASLNFDIHRLGEIGNQIEDVEPIVRNADFLSFDVSAIRQSDAPGNLNATPNGFYGEQACQITRYAGMSDKLTSVGFYELNPSIDKNGQTAHLCAQMIWHFIDGFYNRKKEFPITSKKNYLKYRVALEFDKDSHELIFYKSRISDRWWMDVPYPPQKGIKYERHHLVPCSYSDYELAAKEEMPDKWWKTYKKLL